MTKKCHQGVKRTRKQDENDYGLFKNLHKDAKGIDDIKIEISKELFLTCHRMKKEATSSLKIGDDVVYVATPNCSHRMRAAKMKVLREMAENYDTSKNKEVTLTSK